MHEYYSENNSEDKRENIKICQDYIDSDLLGDEWVRFGMTLMYDYGIDEGRYEFRNWSERGSSSNNRDFNSIWKSLSKKPGYASFKMGTLIFMAKRYGLDLKALAKSKSKFVNIGKIKRLEAKRQTTHAKIQAETADKAAAARKLAMYRHNQATVLDINKPHPYHLMKKGITNPIGVKIYKGWLQIPAFNKQGVLTILQSIRETGFKSILKDSIFSGSTISIGGNPHNEQLSPLLCEGRATRQSLHTAIYLGYPQTKNLQLVIAFNSNNLSHIEQNIREHYPDHPILIGADNDTQNTVNTGVLKAKDIQTQMSQVKVVYPEFTTEDVQRLFQGNGSVPTDFNDMHLLHSLEHVMKYLRSRANSVLEYNQGNYLSINI